MKKRLQGVFLYLGLCKEKKIRASRLLVWFMTGLFFNFIVKVMLRFLVSAAWIGAEPFLIESVIKTKPYHIMAAF